MVPFLVLHARNHTIIKALSSVHRYGTISRCVIIVVGSHTSSWGLVLSSEVSESRWNLEVKSHHKHHSVCFLCGDWVWICVLPNATAREKKEREWERESRRVNESNDTRKLEVMGRGWNVLSLSLGRLFSKSNLDLRYLAGSCHGCRCYCRCCLHG